MQFSYAFSIFFFLTIFAVAVSCFTGLHSQKHSSGICSPLLHLKNTAGKR